MKERICLYTTPFPWINSYCQIIDWAADHGLTAIEGFNNFEFENPDLEKARCIKAYADSKGVHFACLSVYVDLCAEDAANSMKSLKKYAQVAAVLGSPYLHHTISPDHVTPNRAMLETFYKRGVAAVQEIYDYAANLGVKTVYEDQGYVFNGVAGFDRFLREVDRDVGVVIDLGNIFQVDETPEAFIAAHASRACHAHIKNVACSRNYIPGWLETLHGNYFDCRRPDDGIVDLRHCVALLEESGYCGCYGLEFSAGPGGEAAMENYIDQAVSWLEQ